VEPLVNQHSLKVVEGSGIEDVEGPSCSMEDGCVTCSA